MTCRKVMGSIGDFVDEELDVTEKAALEGHLAACPPCRHYLAGYRATIAAVKSAHTDDDSSPERVHELVDRVLASMGRKRRSEH